MQQQEVVPTLPRRLCEKSRASSGASSANNSITTTTTHITTQFPFFSLRSTTTTNFTPRGRRLGERDWLLLLLDASSRTSTPHLSHLSWTRSSCLRLQLIHPSRFL